MKRKYANWLIMLVVSILFGCTSGSNSNDHSSHNEEGKKKVVYTCPMHPQIQQSKPGSCPICKMDLVLKIDDLSVQIQAPNNVVISRQSTVKLESGNSNGSLDIKGFIDLDRTRNRSVAARFSGRIEKLYVKYDFQWVNKGEKILEIYSPELNTAQEEHLFLFSQAEKNILDQSRRKLRLLGLTEQQVKNLEQLKKIYTSIAIYSPYSGYVLFSDNGLPSVGSSKSSQGMASMGTSNEGKQEREVSSSTGQRREGQYVKKGETYFSVNDLATVWAILSVPLSYSSLLKEQYALTLFSELNPDKALEGKILQIEKTFESKDQRFLQIRVPLVNQNKWLKINSLVNAKLPLNTTRQFRVPSSSVIRTGLNAYVWVKIGNIKKGSRIFKLRSVILGGSTGKYILISSGLEANEEIALEAGLLTDSETFLSHE